MFYRSYFYPKTSKKKLFPFLIISQSYCSLIHLDPSRKKVLRRGIKSPQRSKQSGNWTFIFKKKKSSKELHKNITKAQPSEIDVKSPWRTQSSAVFHSLWTGKFLPSYFSLDFVWKIVWCWTRAWKMKKAFLRNCKEWKIFDAERFAFLQQH